MIIYLVFLRHLNSPDLHVFLPDLGVARDTFVLEVSRHDVVVGVGGGGGVPPITGDCAEQGCGKKQVDDHFTAFTPLLSCSVHGGDFSSNDVSLHRGNYTSRGARDV